MNNESDLTKAIAKKFDITQAKADEIVDFSQAWIAETAKKHGFVKLDKYGRFTLKSRPDRVKRNPRTGEKVNKAADFTLTYKPYKKTLEIVNG